MSKAKTKTPPKLTKPAPLSEGHILTSFASTEEVLNVWLQKRALVAVAAKTASTFVVCRGKRVVGYYSLAAGSIAHADCTSDLRRNTPDPVPAFVLARLAVSEEEAGKGLGPALVQDAMRRVLLASRHVAARTLIVHALNDRAAAFYKKLGFLELPAREGFRVFHLKLETISMALAKSAQQAT